jgi:hypothetical protein
MSCETCLNNDIMRLLSKKASDLDLPGNDLSAIKRQECLHHSLTSGRGTLTSNDKHKTRM